MEQYIVVNDNYTKGQRSVLDKLNTMFGKVYREDSLVSELNRILSRNTWESFSSKENLTILSNILDMNLDILFVRLNRQEYKLSQIRYS